MSKGQWVARYILARAADILERDGWCQGGQLHGPGGTHCVVGALSYALRGVGLFTTKIEPFAILRTSIGLGPRLDLGRWNDAPAQTEESVIATLRKAAES